MVRLVLRFGQKLAFATLLISFVLSGCSTGGRRLKKRQSRLIVPAGVDSTVAMRADTLADNLFVSIGREQRSISYKAAGKRKTTESDTLWRALANEHDPGYQVSRQDSIEAIEAFNAGARNLQDLARAEQNAAAHQKAQVQRLLMAARKNLERAVMLNPFDLDARSWLARVYQTLAARFLDEKNHKKAIEVLEGLTRIEKGEHTLFARLAEAYYGIDDWQSAYANFAQAEMVLRSAAGLDFSAEPGGFQETVLDTSALFYYVYYQGDTQIKLHDAARGLHNLNRALIYASTAQERADIQSYIDWINWDGGNTRAVELRDKYMALQEAGQYREAAKGFLKLIPRLTTRSAIDETVWRLAVLEFQFLERRNEGIDRLKHVVQQAQTDANGAPIDTTYRRYFNSYGIMCHNLGLENSKKNRKVAFMYFQQAVAVDWESRAKSHLEIAKLSRNNPKAALKACKGALARPEQLDATEQMQAYQLMVESLKRTGRFEEARKYYADWMKMRNGDRRVSR